MQQEVARKLFEEGAVAIIAGIPCGVEFGVDLSAYAVGEKFRGIKMIPPGFHFLFTAVKDSALRVGFAHYFRPKEIVIREWDGEHEELKAYTKDDLPEQIFRVSQSIHEIDRFLAPYDYESFEKWQSLTNGITNETILNNVPLNNLIRTSADFQSCIDAERPRGEPSSNTENLNRYSKQTEDDLLPNFKNDPDSVLGFTRIPAICTNDATPAEISQAHMDRIRTIEKYFGEFDDVGDAIGEIQLSFVLYLSGYSLDALAHWRNLLRLLSHSDAAVAKFKSFYVRYLEVLEHQLPELPEELMQPSENNTVYKDVGKLIVNCHSSGLEHEVERIQTELANQLSWSFVDFFQEDPDEMPVVVEL